MNLRRKSAVGNFKSNMLVPMKWAGQDRKFADSVKENLDVITGNRGDPLDRAITARDLLESGLAKLPAGSLTFGGNSSELIPPSQIPDLLTPPAPTNLQAVGAFQNILLSWDLPIYTGHAHVEIWRNATDNIATAAMLATTTQAVGEYPDNVGEGASFYYWVRAINKNDIAGPFNASAGTLGQTAPDIQFLLTLLAGQITSSELAASLSTPIGSIPSISNTASTAAAAAASAVSQVGALQATVAALQNVSAWASNITYAQNDQVTHLGGLYAAIPVTHQSTNANAPVSGASNATWNYLGNYTSLSSAVAGNTASITDINTISSSSSSAAAVKISALDSTLNNPTSGLSVQAGIISAISQNIAYNGTTQQSKVDSLEAVLDDGSGNLVSTSAISTLINEVYPNGLTSQSTIALLSQNSNTGGNTLTTAAANALLNTVFPSGITSQSSISSLSAVLEKPNGTLVSAGAVDSLVNNVYPNGTSSSSLVTQLENVLKKPDNSLVSSGVLSSLESEVFPNGLSNNSSIDTLQSGYANPDGTAGTVSLQTAMSTQASVNGDLKAQYSVKIDANGHVAGFGLSSTLVNGTPSSAFIVNADKFAVVHPTDTSAMTNSPSLAHVPFIVTAATTIDGVSVPAGAYMKSAFIHDGSITNARIRNAAIDNAKIASVSAGKINTGTLDASLVTIAGVAPSLNIRSANSGARMQITAANVQIFDANGIRVKLGQL